MLPIRIDHYFDAMVSRFKNNIYTSRKGQIRLAVQRECIRLHVPQIEKGGQRIIEVGGGMGIMAHYFAQFNNDVLLTDASKPMLDEAVNYCGELLSRIDIRHLSIQQLTSDELGKFDVVTCYAVMEWLNDPQAAVAKLTSLLAPEGRLILMFFNKHSITYRNILNGNFYAADKEDIGGDGKGLTPINPIDPELMQTWLEDNQLDVIHKTGVRCFSDYIDRVKIKKISDDDLLAMELKHCQHSPFKELARYQHWVIKHR